MALTEAASPEGDASGTRRILLDVTGMTCGACSGRVQRTLNKIDGVTASVSLKAKVATVDAEPQVSVDQLCAAVTKAGYRATERTEPVPATDGGDSPGQRNVWSRLVAAAFGH